MADHSNSKVIRGVVSMGGGNLLALVCSFLVVSVSARVLPEEDFGIYFLLLSIVYLFQALGGLGLRTSAARFVAGAQDDEDRRMIVNNVLSLALVILLVTSVLTLVSKPLMSLLFPSGLLSALYLYIPLVLCAQAADMWLDAIMQGFQLYRKMALVKVFTSTLNFVLVVLLLLVVELGVEGVTLAYFFSLASGAVVRFWIIPGPKQFMLTPPFLRRLIRFGLPLQGNDILTFVSERLDMMLLGVMLNPTSVAYLGVASKIPQNLYRVSESIFSVYFPYTANLFGHGQRAEAEEGLNGFLRLTAFVSMGGALAIILFHREIVLLAFSSNYVPSGPALVVLTLVLVFSVATTILDYTLIAAGHPDYLPLISLSVAIPNVIANLILIPLVGFMGAAWAKLIGNITTIPVVVWGLRRERIQVRLGEYFRPLVILGTCLAIYFGLGWDSIVIKGLLLTLFVILSMVFSVITGDDLETLLKSLSPSMRHQVTHE